MYRLKHKKVYVCLLWCVWPRVYGLCLTRRRDKRVVVEMLFREQCLSIGIGPNRWISILNWLQFENERIAFRFGTNAIGGQCFPILAWKALTPTLSVCICLQGCSINNDEITFFICPCSNGWFPPICCLFVLYEFD